jgi:hypothetical protein
MEINKKYNKKCNKYFTSEILDKYNIDFYNDNNNMNFIVLKIDNISIWAKYKILCIYDISNNFILESKNMIIIEKNILDNDIKFNKKHIKNINDLDNQIKEELFNYDNIGFVKTIYNDKCYYYLIKEIIKL